MRPNEEDRVREEYKTALTRGNTVQLIARNYCTAVVFCRSSIELVLPQIGMTARKGKIRHILQKLLELSLL